MNRSEISTALAKALAYAQCGKQSDAPRAEAAYWAALDREQYDS